MPQDEFKINRRSALAALLAGLFVGPAPLAVAGDDGGGDGGGDGGSDGGGDDGGGDDGGGDDGGNSGSGSGNSGNDDDSDDDSDDSDDDSKVRDAVRRGDAAPLKDILAIVRQSYPGKIVRIRLTGSGKRLTYNIRILDPQNRLIEIRVNAKSRRVTGPKLSFY